ncbi:HEAT repeat domain-containing protein [Natrinema halophilum]|uniref:HEAT repeat domain-containing protein n=1 Tax=Natrinema halophilum TaxID=1699371 RepID=A0A7D5GQD8_9EURY|nr:HEAT repeat domain-containing protein [Natrinema halophilum]QLG47629.1 HEAT repeat domain-containing protein [Natrinema halophilum]
MIGEGGEAVEYRGRGAAEFDLPSVLAQLDGQDPSEQLAAVRRIRSVIEEHERPAACVPTVPKLRSLLERTDVDFHEEIATCLAELAVEAPSDVAPSTGTIAAVAVERADQPVARELLRCLAAVAAERPAVVGDHTAAIVSVLEQRRGYDRHGLRILAHVSRRRPEEIVQAVSVLTEALKTNPTENGRPVLRAFSRLARSGTTVPSLEFVEHAVDLVDHDETPLRYDAIGCLGDVAAQDPAAVESVCDDLAVALSCADPDTRATAAVTLARVAAERQTAINPVRSQLLGLLTDDHAHVRANACAALGHGRVDAAATRLASLEREDPSAIVRDRAGWALEQLS